MIRGSVVGRNVQIGAKTKISNSIILGNVNIGSECIIQNALILSKATVFDKQTVKDQEVEHGSTFAGE